MTHSPTGCDPAAMATPISRRTLLGIALAAGVLGPMVVLGAGPARADGATDDSTDSQTGSEEYEIPDGIGSAPWW